MAVARSLSASLQHLNRTLLSGEFTDLPDAELVRRFVERRDDIAFAVLVRRYGMLVLGVCRRVLRHEHDAEDAFQATFLVFARDASSVERAGAIGNWLYGVANNIARKAKAVRYRREQKERAAGAACRTEVKPVVPNDLPQLLDKELTALPDKYRAPIVLCDLLGLTTEQAATEVGCLSKTLGTRLDRGRKMLARRLTRRGLTLSAALIPAALAPCTSAYAAVPPQLLDSSTQAALSFATGSATASPAVAALTQGVTNVMVYTSLKYALVACAAIAVGTLSGGKVWQHIQAAQSTPVAAGRSVNTNDARPESPRDADDKKDEDKPKPLTGTWVRKEKEVKLEFGEKNSLKLSPIGDDDKVLIICEYTLEKDGLVKAKVTEVEGAAKEKVTMVLPVGNEFNFKWKVEKDTAKLEDLTDFTIERFKTLIEGEYGAKK